jgi:hypothetical protein
MPWLMTIFMALTIEQGIIMVCTPDLYMQEFRFQGAEMRMWKHKFLARLNKYYEEEPKIDQRIIKRI